MALSEFNRLVADATINAPGVTASGVRAELFYVLRDFLDNTNVWIEDIDLSVTTTASVYPITPAGNGRINRLVRLYDPQDPYKRPVAACRMDTPGTLELLYAPGTDAQWVVRVAKVVLDPVDTDGYPVIDDWVVQKYWPALLAGVMGRLHMQGGKNWSNPKMGALRWKDYLAKRAECRAEVARNNVIGQVTGGFPYFARGSQRCVG